MSTPGSALGTTLAGAGSVISGVGSLLPTTTSQSGSYENEASASSNTVGVQGNISANTTVQDILNNLVNKSQSSQTEAGKSTGRTTQSGTSSAVESFSGQQNQTMQQTLLTEPAVMRIVNLMLQGDGGVPGLQQVASGERNAGVFNSSTNQLLLNNLLTTVAGEVARISAPVVTNQNLGATSTAQSGQSSVVADTINNILNQLSSGSAQEQTESSQSTQDSIAQLLSFALQNTEQESESKGTSKTKTKTKKFPSAVGFIVFGLMGATVENPVYANNQAFAKNEFTTKELLDYYKFSKRLDLKLRNCPIEEVVPTLQQLNINYITPVAEAYAASDVIKAKRLYSEMLTVI